MFKRKKILNSLLSNLKTLQFTVLDVNTPNALRHKALKDIQNIKNRIDLLYMKYRLKVHSIYEDEIIIKLTSQSSYKSSDYFFDIINYQLGKVMKDFNIIKIEITHEGYINTYKISKQDIEIFKFTINDIYNQLKNGTWLIDSKFEDDDEKKYINYVRLDTRCEFLI